MTFLNSSIYKDVSLKTKAVACITSSNLSKFLPENCIKLDVKNSSEFNYSINRPKVVSEIKYNRISRWGAIKLHHLNINVANEQASQQTNETFACRLEVDISTGASTIEEIPSNKIVEIFAELNTLADQISDNGDI